MPSSDPEKYFWECRRRLPEFIWEFEWKVGFRRFGVVCFGGSEDLVQAQ
jgi:hypothetical protein